MKLAGSFWMKLPSRGRPLGKVAYRRALTISFFLKFYLGVLQQLKTRVKMSFSLGFPEEESLFQMLPTSRRLGSLKEHLQT
jgi:hypothetical protein